MKAVKIECDRTSYSPKQVVDNYCPMTVGELKALLSDLDDDAVIILSHDHGYSYGSLSECDFREISIKEDED